MLYRIAGQYKTSYTADQALFPVRQDAILLGIILVIAYVVFPLTASEYAFKALLLPVLVYALAALGLNILTGYAGQLSLGTGAFMGVGAYACSKLTTIFPEMNFIVAVLLSGFFSAGIGVVFGIPSLRIKGFYLAIATLAAQFFLVWLFEKWHWLNNYTSSGAIETRNFSMFGYYIAGPLAPTVVKYYLALVVVTLVTWLALNLTRGNLGRIWKATRDMDIAAELIGIRLMWSKLYAFAVSSYIIGVAGALFVFVAGDGAEPNAFDIPLSFTILFIAIIGGLGSVMGNFLGAILIVAIPAMLNDIPPLFNLTLESDVQEYINQILVGAMILFFLIIEPLGLASFWRLIREKLIIWPFPH